MRFGFNGLWAAMVLVAVSCPSFGQKVPQMSLSKNDVIWNSPSEDAAGSMPIGNGEVVLNVWVEASTGDLLFYIARTDALSEISRYLKLGQVRVHLENSPLKGAANFRQHLHLQDGYIEVTGGDTTLKLFVDSDSHVVHVQGESKKAGKVSATVVSWRNEPRTLPKDEQASAWTASYAPVDLVESADVFLKDAKPSVTWYHRNETSIVPTLWQNQSLTGLAGAFDPLIHRTFGGRLEGDGFVADGERGIVTSRAVKSFSLRVATETFVGSVGEWTSALDKVMSSSPSKAAAARTKSWWNSFWERSWVFADESKAEIPVPKNAHPLRLGVDSGGGSQFKGSSGVRAIFGRALQAAEVLAIASEAKDFVPANALQSWPGSDEPNPNAADKDIDLSKGLTLSAWIKPTQENAGRIFDKVTAGVDDGFLFDNYPANGLRFICGPVSLRADHVLKIGEWQYVTAVFNSGDGSAAIYVNGRVVGKKSSQSGQSITQGYVLQRYVQACQGRGYSPIKFNGGFYTVEPKAMGRNSNADFRNWGDSHWYQNVRHMYHPMLQQGDFEMMEPFFKMYESCRQLAESRTALYHGAKGAYFPETMSIFGTYAGNDYGWDRKGHQPNEVMSPWWRYAWNQGPEFVSLMLDRWDYTRDEKFLKERVLPMAESVLQYFDTRFKKDAQGKIVLDPTQVVETYWKDVVNDMPSTAGLIYVTQRLNALPQNLLSATQREFFKKMGAACPDLPLETVSGAVKLAPAQKYNPEVSNVENGELYGVWPFELVSVAHPKYLEEAKRAYAARKNHLDVGWGYDGNVAALLGMTDEAARILRVKCSNSHPAYRWPATWGPNFDWLPDQNHGGNLLNTANLMLLQAEPIEAGGAIRLFPAWPKSWGVDFKLRAPGNTTVHCIARSGVILRVEVVPASREKDIVWPAGWEHPK